MNIKNIYELIERGFCRNKLLIFRGGVRVYLLLDNKNKLLLTKFIIWIIGVKKFKFISKILNVLKSVSNDYIVRLKMWRGIF